MTLFSQLLKNFDPGKLLNIDKIRTEVDTLLTTKLQELKPSTVKKVRGGSDSCAQCVRGGYVLSVFGT